MSKYNYVIRICKDHLKDLYSFVESIEVFQYYPAKMQKNRPDMSSEQAREYIVQLESAIKMIQKPEATDEFLEKWPTSSVDIIGQET